MSATPSLRGERVAGALLWRGGPAAALAVAVVTLAAAVLVPLRLWTPVAVLPVLLVLGAVGWRLLRLVPSRPAPVWTAALTVALSAGFGVWAAATRAEQVALRRDSGTYALYAQWIATRHGLPIDAHLDAFGGAAAALAVPGATVASPGFFEVTAHGTTTVVPQFLVGAPALYSLGWWAAGWTGLFVVPAILGALALLAFGGLAGRLVGPRWAPLAVAALGLTQPVLHAARATWSEAPALLLLVAAAALAVDAVVEDRVGTARVAGLLTGLAGLVRLDAPREVAVLVAVCALLVLRRSRVAVPMATTALEATLVAALSAAWFSLPYVVLNSSSVLPLLGGLAVTVALFAVTATIAARRAEPARAEVGEAALVLAAARTSGAAGAGPPDPAGPLATDGGVHHVEPAPAVGWRRPLPLALGALVALTGLLLASRPWWMVARQPAKAVVRGLISDLQEQQGLPVDEVRTYAEQTVTWVSWYTGWIALVLALATLTVLAVRAGVWWEQSRDRRRAAPGVAGAGRGRVRVHRARALPPGHHPGSSVG